MNCGTLHKHLQGWFILVILAMITGCVSGVKTTVNEDPGKGSIVAPASPGKVTSVSIIPAGAGVFIIQGNNVDDIAGFDLTINYDSSILSAPTVTNSVANSGAMMAANTNTPGTIRFVMISSKPFSGTVPLAKASFASVKGEGGISITSASMVNSKGVLVK